MRSAIAALAIAAALSAIGCESPDGFDPTAVGRHFVEVRRDAAVIQRGKVGAGRHEGPGTWVLVDVANPLDVDVHVQLVGDLLDARGRAVGVLNEESLRIPAGGLRTFALVHHLRDVPEAAAADIRVQDVRLAKYPPAVTLSEQNVYRDGDRVVVAAHLNNTTDRELIVLVVAGFYDAGGRVMKRPFTVLKLRPNAKEPVRFVGPDGSAAGYLFVAEEVH